MDERIDTLASILDRFGANLALVTPDMHDRPTPCDEFDVGALTNHLAVWVQVFEAAVTDGRVDFDPYTETVAGDRAVTFATAAAGIVSGLRADGHERPMSMGGGPMPGEMILNMMLMEYVGHAWDLWRSVGIEPTYTEAEVSAGLTAAKAIVQPEHRVPGMFGPERPAPDGATDLERLMAFLGRDLSWTPAVRAATGP